jgi:uncharacterized protein YjcR
MHPPETVAAIERMAAEGVQGIEIASRLGIKIGNLRSWASRRGLRFRRPATDEVRRNKRLHLMAWKQDRGLKRPARNPDCL